MSDSLEDELSESQKDFIGSTFLTPKGGTLTVTGVYLDKNGGIKKGKSGVCYFSVNCSVCNKDTELFPQEFSCLKDKLIHGQCPCGCSQNHVYTKYQQKIRVKRECIDKGYEFRGFKGDFHGNQTKLRLYNPSTGNFWDTCTIANFFRGRGDPVEARIKVRNAHLLDDKVHIEDFYKAGFTKDYRFWKSERVDSRGSRVYWHYTCPVCSHDEYVQNGLCTGIFESTVRALKLGKGSCRCYNYYWTQEQREYQINKICKEEGLTFLGWESEKGYINSSSKFIWVCTENHENSSYISSFRGGNRCGTCYRSICTLYGYYPDRKDEEDYLYVISFNDEYLKVGRSFNIEKRIKGGRGLLRLSGMKRDQLNVLKVYTGKHQIVYNTEQLIHKELHCLGLSHEESNWTIETFKMSSEMLIYKLLEDSELLNVNIGGIYD